MAHKSTMYTADHWESLTPERKAEINKAEHETATPASNVKAAPAKTDVGTKLGHDTTDAIKARKGMLREALESQDKNYEPWNSTTPWPCDHAHLDKK